MMFGLADICTAVWACVVTEANETEGSMKRGSGKSWWVTSEQEARRLQRGDDKDR